MSKFITGEELEKKITDIIWEAQETLLIVSPYIQLDDHFKKIFKKHIGNPNLHILIIFGKNEQNRNKSFSTADIDYFKQFPNISIIYAPYLHAKYYANESEGVITSINLYDYSFKNNIEFGVHTKLTLLNAFTGSTEDSAWEECQKIASVNNVIFIKRPVYDKKLFSKNYMRSEILCNQEVSLSQSNDTTMKLSDFPKELDHANDDDKKPERVRLEDLKTHQNDAKPKIKSSSGYCIRTGISIPFDVEKPFCIKAFKNWSVYSNKDFPEKFCHFSGEQTNGANSFKQPILKKNWTEAKQTFNF